MARASTNLRELARLSSKSDENALADGLLGEVRKPSHTAGRDSTMRLRFLGKCGSNQGGCPTLYATDRDTYVVQGWRTNDEATVEIPHSLLGFAEADTFVGATMADTGRGTFTVSGEPLVDPEALAHMSLAIDETAIEVPKRERTFYGAVDHGR
ncbi:hypothetical protein [Nocardia xishanensis]|uniref:hypothetical protein n=1 Tax=Nocardia xishanensis TaxID=238964 RepID=UPI001FE20478|nr:hypothetical protein [Nocardia xishanensis]